MHQFPTCQWSYSRELWNLHLLFLQRDWLIHTWNCKGPTFPKKDDAYSNKYALFLFYFVLVLYFFAWKFLRCSKMMSRNSIRRIKGQNQIELIYDVNNESLKIKKKVWTSFLLKHKLLVNRRGALFTFQWEYITKMTWWGGSYCNALVVSMISIFLSAPVTILPLYH